MRTLRLMLIYRPKSTLATAALFALLCIVIWFPSLHMA